MPSDSDQPPRKRRPQPTAAPSLTTILDLEENLLLQIFLRLPSLPSLVRAALSCRPFLGAVRASPAFRRRFRALHPPPLLGFFLDSSGLEIPSFAPVRRRADPDLAAAVRGADVFLTRVPYEDDASPGWEIEECHGGYALLINRSTDQLAAYNPLTWALDLLPMPPGEISAGRRGKLSRKSFFVLSSDESPGSFRVVSFCHDESRVRAAVFSSATAQWQILPWSEPCLAQQPGKKNRLLWGKHVNGNLYWPNAEQPYQVVLDTAALQFSVIDLPEQSKGRNDLYMTGETKDGELCIVSVVGFQLYLWFRRADADGVDKWMIDDVIPLEREILQATGKGQPRHYYEDDDVPLEIKVWAVLDGTVYFTTLTAHSDIPCWFLSFCLETRKLEKLFRKTFHNGVYPYIMAWPPSLVGNQMVETHTTTRKETGGRVPRGRLALWHDTDGALQIDNLSEWISIDGPKAGGFGPLLQHALETLGIRDEPKYLARRMRRDGQYQWEVRILVPASPRIPDDEPWSVRRYGSKILEALAAATHYALTVLTEHHHQDLSRLYGYLPVRDQTQVSWRSIVDALKDPEHVTYDPNRRVVCTGPPCSTSTTRLTWRIRARPWPREL